MLEEFQTPGHKDPVFSLQRHDVGNGTQADHVGIIRQDFLLAAAQSAGQLECHANTGQVLVGVTAVGTMGVHHGHGFRQDFFTFVMVGDDQVNAVALAHLGFFHGGDAAVYGDDELDAIPMKLINGDGVQTIALLQTAGDIGHAIRTTAPEKVRQQTGGGDAVHVIVAENGDFFAPVHGKTDPAGGQVHIGHQQRAGQRGVAIQVSTGTGTVGNSPGSQNNGGQRGVSAADQIVDCTGFRIRYIPNSVFQN